MATYRYWEIRRDVYEQCSNNPPKKYRTFADMKKLFKASYWLMLIGMIFCLLAYLILFVVFPDKFFWIIPVCCTFALGFISEFFGEKMYNHSERKKELKETSTNLDKYIESIKNTLEAHGIVTKEQRQILKSECEKQLSLHSKNYKSVSNKVFDMLVGVPLGAFISALIFKSESTDVIFDQLFALIIIGVMIIGTANIFRKITYYSDGHFKDQYLLDILNELEYLSE
jgi:hypothetical protein